MDYLNKGVYKTLEELEQINTLEEYAEMLAPLTPNEIADLNSNGFSLAADRQGLKDRIDFLKERDISIPHIHQEAQADQAEALKGNIENFIGMAQIPIGLAGPLLINGTKANGEFFVPLATTEGALVASYNRGMKACRLSGGVTSVCLTEGIQRSPFFKFENIRIVALFVKWLSENKAIFSTITEKTSRFAKFIDLKTNIEGNSVILTFEFTTGDASGQNMVTICTDQICKFILENFEITPKEWYIESNYSGDKKATAVSFSNVRGKKVTSEIVVPRNIVKDVLKTTPEKISRYWQSSTLAVIQSGSIGAQGHVANGLTALFIACGQDVACISESSIGLTRMETNAEGDLYVSVTLPSLAVGTIGGGTKLPTQSESLKIMDCAGIGKAKKFAEICGAVALAGEISIAAAMSVDHFTTAHKNLGR
jgi:hydroxymethylglutaryl-CoA reductase (NADPH)